ncbi:MAG: fatty acid desaturase [Fibrobacteria bacterium]|nr:fatty acid desaturase [Fibrobacteria bacterium]
MSTLQFTPRGELSQYEWDSENPRFQRIKLDPKTLRQLTTLSNKHGLIRVGLFTLSLLTLALTTVFLSRYSILLALPVLYAYYFLFGFWTAIAHELQHKIVFAKSWEWGSEKVFFFVQALLWNGPCYARVSHMLHHRYTMIRGTDPETDWPEVITSEWLNRVFQHLLLKIFMVGAIIDLLRMIGELARRGLGKKSSMMRDHCSDEKNKRIKHESVAILAFHSLVILFSIWVGSWWPIIFITIATPVGEAFFFFWHFTEHIGRLYNVNDQRLCTRSVKTHPFIRLIYGGLDDHVDHHLFPGVPSRNLPELHKLIEKDLPTPGNMRDCWKEMFAIAKEKDKHPDNEYVPINL